MSKDEAETAAAAAAAAITTAAQQGKGGDKQPQTRHPAVDFAVAGSATSCACVLSNPVSDATSPPLLQILCASVPCFCAPRFLRCSYLHRN